ncbi:MAG: glycoside hydrolase family 16 protein [Planctomycetia bacterium]|nr:glycoside hydrolase family 16 protein [Planctomycetia bacterium]
MLKSVLWTVLLLIPNALIYANGPEGAADSGWKLVFEDTFDNSGKLDDQKWIEYYRPGQAEYKAAQGKGSGKSIKAHYVIENGILKIRIDKDLPKRKSPLTGTVSSIQTSRFTWDKETKTAKTIDKFTTKYGWFELRCRMPKGSGLHSAFWLLQKDADKQEYTLDGQRKKVGDGVVEIDIFEMLGGKVEDRINYFNVHFTKTGHYKYPFDFDCSKEFHNWALNWEEGRLTWYLDGKKIKVYEGETPKEEMYILLGLYMGSGWTGKVDPEMPFPRDFEIDFLRVWKK